MKEIRIFSTIIAAAWLFSACNVTKHLDVDKGERLLIKNSLELHSEDKLGLTDRAGLQYELAGLYKQQPNRRFLGLFQQRVWLYHKFIGKVEKSKSARWVIKYIAEAPVIYNDELAQLTARNFQNSMRQRGYFDASCHYKAEFKGLYKAQTTYTLNLGHRYRIHDVHYTSKDSALLEALRLNLNEGLLKNGEPVDRQLFEAERLRIANGLRNRGYAYFAPNYIEFVADTANKKATVSVDTRPLNDTLMHKTYTIKNITVLVGLVPEVSEIRRDTLLNGIYFATSDPEFKVKPERLYDYIEIHPEWPYRQVDFDQTARNLNALGIFRFVAIRHVQDSLQPNKINVDIKLTPSNSFSYTMDLPISYSYGNSAVANNLVGLSPNVSVRNRNTFGGAETFQNVSAYSIEFAPFTGQRFIPSQEVNIQNQLALPRFIDYFGLWRGLHGIKFGKSRRLLSDNAYQRLKDNSLTRIGLNYNYVEIFGFYDYNIAGAGYGYEFRSGSSQYTVNHIALDIFQPNRQIGFDSIAQKNEFLNRSFREQLFSGFLLRSFSFDYAGKPNVLGERVAFHFGSDLSGAEAYLVEKITRKNLKLGGLEFSHYLRLDLDAAWSREFRKDVIGAMHLGVGTVIPFADTTAPYAKQFSIGGPSSLRAWRIRELGPGSYRDTAAVEPPFYQAGDFRFEMNAEVRFPLFWWINGAVFVDAGNIWTLRRDYEREGSQLRKNSYRNIAVGAGFGLRFDFSYLIFRLDFGLPLRNPYPADRENDKGYWVKNRISKLQPRDFAPNIAIGYPF